MTCYLRFEGSELWSSVRRASLQHVRPPVSSATRMACSTNASASCASSRRRSADARFQGYAGSLGSSSVARV